jgi:hypothetical protein
MWPWIKRWRDWAMHDLLHMHRASPQPQALHYSYDKAGLTVNDQPIPWNADVVTVEALLRRLPHPTGRRKADFQLRIADQEPIEACNLRPDDAPSSTNDQFRVFFRLPPPSQTTTAAIYWKTNQLGQLTLPVLGREEFVERLGLQMPTLSVRIGNECVACQTYVSTQCKGLIASALLTSPTSLAPMIDLGLHIEFRSERTGTTQIVPVQLSSTQLQSRQALITVVPLRTPRSLGSWLATWMLDDRPLATQRIRAISKRHFQRSLRMSDCHFLIRTVKGNVLLTRQIPPLAEIQQAVPCFLVNSKEQGMAGLCRLEIRSVPNAASEHQGPSLEQEVLITDGPTRFAPGSLDPADLGDVIGFELRLKKTTLGMLSLSPAPAASFTSEGGFKPACEFAWSPSADEELNERLAKLLEERGSK